MTIERLEYLKRIIDCRAPIINKEVNAELHSLIDAEVERQKEPCFWCNNNPEMIVERVMPRGMSNDLLLTSIHYCPQCGKKLTASL